MKAVTTEQIRLMRAKYEEQLGVNAPLVQVINECLEYRYAEEQAAEFAEQYVAPQFVFRNAAGELIGCVPANPLPQGDGDPRPRTPLEIECGPSVIAMLMDKVQ